MTKIARKYDFSDGMKVKDFHLDDEFNNLVDGHNAQDDQITDRYTKTEVDSRINAVSKTLTIQTGAAFPAGPYNEGQMFWRSDEKKMYAWSAATGQFEPVLAQGPGSGLNADMVDGKHAADLETKTNSGYFFDNTTPFPANTTVTKRVPLGGPYKQGRALFHLGTTGATGAVVFFTTDSAEGSSYSNGPGSTYTPEYRSKKGSGRVQGVGQVVTASGLVFLDSVYIDSATNELVIVINNTFTSAFTANYGCQWEVIG